ncbi:hypothetical protein ACC695_38260, partial [Rhizobium ruizarguesonis]
NSCLCRQLDEFTGNQFDDVLGVLLPSYLDGITNPLALGWIECNETLLVKPRQELLEEEWVPASLLV